MHRSCVHPDTGSRSHRPPLCTHRTSHTITSHHAVHVARQRMHRYQDDTGRLPAHVVGGAVQLHTYAHVRGLMQLCYSRHVRECTRTCAYRFPCGTLRVVPCNYFMRRSRRTSTLAAQRVRTCAAKRARDQTDVPTVRVHTTVPHVHPRRPCVRRSRTSPTRPRGRSPYNAGVRTARTNGHATRVPVSRFTCPFQPNSNAFCTRHLPFRTTSARAFPKVSSGCPVAAVTRFTSRARTTPFCMIANP